MSTQQALTKKPEEILATWKHDLNRQRSNLQRALPPSYPVDRFIHAAYVAVKRTPKLLECNLASLFNAVYTAAELGLVPNGALGHGWIIPYGKDATWVTGYQGLAFLVGKSGLGTVEQPVLVYQRDVDDGRFVLEQGDRRRCRLVGFPKTPKAPKGDLRFAFVTLLLPSGQRTFHVVDNEFILARRDGSKGYQSAVKYNKEHPWMSSYDAMAMKTVIRDACKVWPKSGDDVWSERLGRALEYDDTEEPVIDVESVPTPKESLRAKIQAANPELAASEPSLEEQAAIEAREAELARQEQQT